MRSILFAALLLPGVAAGQDDSLAVGDRVRVTKLSGEVGPRRTGVVVSFTDDFARVRFNVPPSPTESLAFTRLEVARGQRTMMREGAGFGAVAGLALGFVFGYAAGEDCSRQSFICFDRKDTGMMGAIGGALIGTIGGTIIGASKKTDRWKPVVR